MSFVPCIGFRDSVTFLGGRKIAKYRMVPSQYRRGAQPSWIQLSSVTVNILRALDYRAMTLDSITRNMIHTMGSMFVGDTDMYWATARQTC